MVEIENVTKIYHNKKRAIEALKEINLNVNEGEFVVVRGPSGSGKSTLLLAIGGMLKATSGRIIVNGNNIYKLDERKRSKFRAENIGFVFQMFHLIPYLNVIENVLLPTGIVTNKSLNVSKARELLKRLHLTEREYHKPSEMSAGEIQRAALARALMIQPKIILADEPTGNLDPENAAEVIGHLKKYQNDGGTVIVVTHGSVADQYADRIIKLKDGRILAS